MATNIIKLCEELLVIDEKFALVEQELKVAKEKKANIAMAIEAAKSALRESEERTKELTAIFNLKLARANAQQALRKIEAAEAKELSNSPL
ncbi:hypothetical protein TSUD_374720 [Trifolium subterraneum]|uniref:Uncharacterized protein n=1 Tax=Trifolium subterraneum TaxID=3900 RepID=A0A2Z6NRK7_TRISU|nr:hypothetical protein TSUD_374720 [Trifolium subterraneum]